MYIFFNRSVHENTGCDINENVPAKSMNESNNIRIRPLASNICNLASFFKINDLMNSKYPSWNQIKTFLIEKIPIKHKFLHFYIDLSLSNKIIKKNRFDSESFFKA